MRLKKRTILSFFHGNPRTVTLKKNIIGIFFLKGSSILMGFFMVPMCLGYLNSERYGIWILFSTFIGWFNFFEIGLGNGLRNKLAEATALEDLDKAKTYVSTTYAMLIVIISTIAFVFYLVNEQLNWPSIFNVRQSMAEELTLVALVTFSFFFIQFILGTINSVLLSQQETALANALNPVGKLFSIFGIYLIGLISHGKLIYLCFVMSFCPCAVFFVANIWLFSNRYRHIRPSISYVDFTCGKDLMGLGIQFFLINIAGIVLFQSSAIIITQFLGPHEVTPYYIAHKYFSIVAMGFSMLGAPLWSAHTEAYIKKDFSWIKRITGIMAKLWLCSTILVIVMLIISPWFFSIWIGNDLKVPFTISVAFAIHFIIYTFGGIYNPFINGTGKIRIQVLSAVVGAILFVPLAVFLIEYCKLGSIGIIIAMIVANFYGPLIAPFQYHKIIKDTAKGIWNK